MASHERRSSIDMEKADIREHLAEADKKIKDAEKRIAEQYQRIKTLAADGHPTEAAETLLAKYHEMLDLMVQYRKTITGELKTQQSIDSTR
jgi:hypothetical protein